MGRKAFMDEWEKSPRVKMECLRLYKWGWDFWVDYHKRKWLPRAKMGASGCTNGGRKWLPRAKQKGVA